MKIEDAKLDRRAVPGPRLHFVAVLPDAPKAIVGIVPGYADHAARYRHVQEAWAERGIGSVAIDLRGHGRAEGPRGYCVRFEEFLDDVGELTRLVRDRGSPAFLFGHSFGGLVATRSAIADPAPWKGLVLSAPFFGLAMAVSAIKRGAGKIASALYPRLALPTGIRGADVTHDEARARAYDQDPLVFKKATARWFVETERAQRAVMASARSLELPLEVIFGQSDPIASLRAARAFFDAAGSKDKRFDPLPGLRHEPLSETSWRSVADKLADWMMERA
jgi:alpha-beta hydrolase superfamily lysophospholipase